MSIDSLIDRLRGSAATDVSRETLERLQTYERMLREEAGRQNLVSASTLGALWERHIVDSAQLLRFIPAGRRRYADVGSGAGLPGVVIACLTGDPVTLIEPRRLRADFLHRVVSELGVDAQVIGAKVERVQGKFDVISARAVSNLAELLRLSSHLSTTKTLWVLPKGRNAASELAEARMSWQGVFHVEHSVTDPESRIIVATGVAKR